MEHLSGGQGQGGEAGAGIRIIINHHQSSSSSSSFSLIIIISSHSSFIISSPPSLSLHLIPLLLPSLSKSEHALHVPWASRTNRSWLTKPILMAVVKSSWIRDTLLCSTFSKWRCFEFCVSRWEEDWCPDGGGRKEETQTIESVS